MENGPDGFIAAEVIKKKLPVLVVLDEKEADYVLSGVSLKGDDKWYNVVFGGKDKNEGNVRSASVSVSFCRAPNSLIEMQVPPVVDR